MRKKLYFWLCLFLSGFILSPTLWFGFTMDQALCHYAVWVWKEYHLPPYLGVWDLSFPGIFLLHRLILEVFGESILGFRLFDFLVQLSLVVMLYYLAGRLFRSSWAGFFSGIIYSLYYLSGGALETGEREGFVLWLLVFSVLIFLWLGKRFWAKAVLVGVILGFAFLLKPSYALSWLVFGFWLLSEKWRESRKSALLLVLVFLGFCLLDYLLVILYYLWQGGLKEFFRATILFNLEVYTRLGHLSAGPFQSRLFSSLYFLLFPHPIFFLLGIFGIFSAGAGSLNSRTRELFWVLLALALVGLVSYFFQGKYFPYHLIPFFGFWAVFAGWGLVKLGFGVRSRIFCWAIYLGVILLMIFRIPLSVLDFALKNSFQSLDSAYAYGKSFDARHYRASKALRKIIPQKAQIEFFGWHPLLPYFLKKKLPSRFCVVYHLLMGAGENQLSSLQRNWIEEYTQSVIKAGPEFFLLADYVPGWRVFKLPSPSLKQALKQYFPKLERFLAQNYQFLGQVEDIEVYQLKPKNSPGGEVSN